MMSARRFVLTLMVTLTGARVSNAQSTATYHPSKWTGVFGVHIGTPDKFSVMLGVGRVVSSRQIGLPTTSGKFSHSDRDIFAAFEPGSRGARLSVGYGTLKDELNQGTIVSGRLSAYRRWSDDSSRVYVGPEISGSAMADVALGLRLGLLRRVRGPAGGKNFFKTADYAVGW
jgi:hypothetical protein